MHNWVFHELRLVWVIYALMVVFKGILTYLRPVVLQVTNINIFLCNMQIEVIYAVSCDVDIQGLTEKTDLFSFKNKVSLSE